MSSTSTTTPSVETVLVGAGALTASVADPTAQTSLQTSASLGSSANVKVTTLIGPLATSVSTASALDVHITAGAITGTALLPDAIAGGGTSAFVAEGRNRVGFKPERAGARHQHRHRHPRSDQRRRDLRQLRQPAGEHVAKRRGVHRPRVW